MRRQQRRLQAELWCLPATVWRVQVQHNGDDNRVGPPAAWLWTETRSQLRQYALKYRAAGLMMMMMIRAESHVPLLRLIEGMTFYYCVSSMRRWRVSWREKRLRVLCWGRSRTTASEMCSGGGVFNLMWTKEREMVSLERYTINSSFPIQVYF